MYIKPATPVSFLSIKEKKVNSKTLSNLSKQENIPTYVNLISQLLPLQEMQY